MRVPLPPRGTCSRRLRFAARRALTWPLRAAFELRTRRTACRAQLFGLDVYVDADSEDPAEARAVVDAVAEALELLDAVDPRRLARMRADVPRLYVEPAAGSYYLAASNAICLALHRVQRYDPETVASVLVHEATHARIQRRGIRAWPDLRPRIERRCVLEQIAFLKWLSPPREDLVAHYQTQLEQVPRAQQQQFERAVRYFEQLGAPRWFLRAYTLVARPRGRP